MADPLVVTPPTVPTVQFYVMQGAKGEPGTRVVGFSLGDGVAVITPGVKFSIEIPFGCVITGWTILGEPSGDLVVDLWKAPYASAPPTVADSITGASKPTVTGDVKAKSTTLTGWTTTVTAGDVLTSYVEAGATMRRATLQLVILPT